MKEFKIGDEAEFSIQITEESNRLFNQLTGDTPNPAHFEKKVMSETFFKKTIASGIQTLSAMGCTMRRLFVSESTMPIAVEINTRFLKPVFVGDTVTCHAKINGKAKTDHYMVEVIVTTQDFREVAQAHFRIKVVKF